MTLGFNRSRSATAFMTRGPEVFFRVVPEGDSRVTTLGLLSAMCYCTRNVYVADIYKNTIVFNCF